MNERQFKALIRATSSRLSRSARRDRFLFYFLGKTGLRISEALALRVRDLYLSDTDSGMPFLRVKTLKRRSPGPTDEVYLDDNTARIARYYLRAILPTLIARPPRQDDCLFPARLTKGHQQDYICATRKAMSRRNALGVFRTYARMAGLPQGITVHSLRHYRGTVLLRRTRDLEFTRQQMLHRSLASTQVYQHSDPELVRDYLNRADRED